MQKKLTKHLTYGNVVASIALFVALGGTSYALTLQRNSVGAAQVRPKAIGASELKPSAVRSRHIRNRAVALSDISDSARSALRGKQGPAGPQGPAGTALSTAMTSGGTIGNGDGRLGGHQPGSGLYGVIYDRDLTSCRAVATLSRVPGGGTVDPPAGEITTSTNATGVTVRTYNSSGVPTDLPFHLVAVC